MNYLFYLGIIVPTLITILLFVVFVYCWFLQKARKEVMTKKYDPHGKMRRLGIPMDPPLPPPYCRMDDHTRFIDNGEDNEAYDVSRSPSTEQDARGRPLYHTYHDSGISAGLSPSQENEPRPGLAYRSCPDSGISGFSVHASMTGPTQQQLQQQQQQQLACRGCCQTRDQSPQHNHHHQHQQQQQRGRPQYLQQPQQVMLHHNTVQASVHPSHGVCYGDDTTHPQSPQHYNPPPMQSSSLGLTSPQQPPAFGGRHFTTMPHIHEQPLHLSASNTTLDENLCYCANSPEHQPYNPHHVNAIQQCCQEEIVDDFIHELPPPPAYPSPPPPAYPSATPSSLTFRPQSQRGVPHIGSSPIKRDSLQTNDQNATMMNSVQTTSVGVRQQPDSHPHPSEGGSGGGGGYPPSTPLKQHLPSLSSFSSSSSSSSPSSSTQQQQLPRHSYRDSGVMDVGQTQTLASERPDSQASTSSTTDSEDSGFRSSHCATSHHGSKLSKQGNPLLKPLRKPKALKTRPKPTSRGRGKSISEDLSVHGATPLSTLNPQTLQSQIPNNNNNNNNKNNSSSTSNNNKPNVIQTTSLFNDNNTNNKGQQRSPPRILQQQSASSKSIANSIIPENSLPTPVVNNYQNDGSGCHSPGSGGSSGQEAAHLKNHHMDMTEISTHVSWKYLQDLSVSSNSSHDTCTSQDELQMIHTNKAAQFQASPEPQMEMFSYSIV